MLAEPFGRLWRACEVRLARLVADALAVTGNPRQPLVRAVNAAAVARPDTAAIQKMLNRGVDVDALRAAGDLDPVSERGDGAMRPAGATVLGNVLVPRHRAVVYAVLVAPSEFLGQFFAQQELVVGALVRSVAAPDYAELLGLLAPQQLAAMAPDAAAAVEDAGRELLGILLREAAAGNGRGRTPSALGVSCAVRLRLVRGLASVVLSGGNSRECGPANGAQHRG
mmetsp:Transcript_107615/g.210900  ORF Transcript_107615/g.210900 Transcript_107615/m.210900 type:complete len:225 (+) Transcript_107615:617-1291(+)